MQTTSTANIDLPISLCPATGTGTQCAASLMISDDGNSSPIRIVDPFVGQSWATEDEAKSFYREYAQLKGFGTRIRTSRKGQDFTMVCIREGSGFKKMNVNSEDEIRRNTSSSRCECGAYISVGQSERTGGMWIARQVVNTHNHPLLSPVSKRFLHSNKEMTETAKHFAQKFQHVGLPMCKLSRVLEGEGNFDSQDCYNYVKKIRSKLIEDGDAQGLLKYCQRAKQRDPQFFYSITVDECGRMENFFWVDSRSRIAYEQFGDVIKFDTTYRTNKYEMPFAPFVGLNHHMQSTLFGCALLQNESEESFFWVFTTFLPAMNGKKPISIITDQDISMGKALYTVMPQTRHRLCYWHITKKFPEKLSHLYKKDSTFQDDFKRCFRDLSSKEEFDKEWNQIIVDYDLVGDSWLAGLFEIRNMWVPIYCRDTFFAGMRTTQRSESMNSFFDHFVHSGTTLHEFIMKFQEAVDARVEECQREDYHTRHKDCRLRLHNPLEQHASEVYTRKVFSLFREELRHVNSYKKEKIEVNGSIVTYKLTSRERDYEIVVVAYDKSSNLATCSCLEFEFKGILCRHILTVFTLKGVERIPNTYILTRWTKDAIRAVETRIVPPDAYDVEMLRLHHLNRAFRLLQDPARVSHEAYQIIISGINELYKTALNVAYETCEPGSRLDSGQAADDASEADICADAISSVLADPYVSKTKGRPRESSVGSSNKRIKGGLEKALSKVQICHGCRETGMINAIVQEKKTHRWKYAYFVMSHMNVYWCYFFLGILWKDYVLVCIL